MENNKVLIKNKADLRKLAEVCEWPHGYRKPISYPAVAVWHIADSAINPEKGFLVLTYVYQFDFQ